MCVCNSRQPISASLSHCQQNSVPHLRTRLQLQQAIMKELLQRQAQEKLQQKQKEQKPAVTNTLASGSGTSNSIHVSSTNSQGVQSVMVGMLGPASTTPQSQNQHTNMKVNNVTATVPPSSLSASSSSSAPPPSIPLPISTTSLTAQLREQLAKLTPQQGQLYMQQLAQANQLQQQQQQSKQQITGASPSSQQPATVNQATKTSSVSVTALNTNALKVTQTLLV